MAFGMALLAAPHPKWLRYDGQKWSLKGSSLVMVLIPADLNLHPCQSIRLSCVLIPCKLTKHIAY